jgi:hypothetical protein
MSRFTATWNLVKQSLAVLRREKKLLIFPFITGSLTIFVFLFFLFPIALQPTGHPYLHEDHWKAVAGSLLEGGLPELESGQAGGWTGEEDFEVSDWLVAYLTLLYLVSMFLLTFFNTAFFHEILHALNGLPVSVGGGLRFALTKLKPILMWSLLAGVVGILIQKLEQYVGFFGRWIVGLIGVVWSVAAVFAVPVLIREKDCDNPFEVLKRSALLIKQRWGEGLIGYVGIRAFGIAMVLGLVVIFPVLLIGLTLLIGGTVPSLTVPIIVAVVAVWILLIFLIAYLENLANKVFQCALYLYAAEGAVPGPFDEALLDSAWKVK